MTALTITLLAMLGIGSRTEANSYCTDFDTHFGMLICKHYLAYLATPSCLDSQT